SFFAVDFVGGLARRPWVRAVQLAGHTIGLLVALYAGALLAFYALPAGVAVARAAVSLSWLRDLASALVHSGGRALFFAIVGLPLVALSAALFVGTPIALPWLYLRSFARVLRAHRAALGDARAAAVPGAVAVAVIGLFLLFDRQPQQAALAALAEPPRDDAARARLLGAEDDLRAGLLAAYLAPYRYLGARGGAHDIEWLYRQELGFSESAAAGVERLFLALASPAIYDGPSLAGVGADAERLYAAVFDSPIQKRESAA